MTTRSAARPARLDGDGQVGEGSVPPTTAERRLWLVLGDPLPNRVFFDCGIVDGLRHELADRVVPIFPLHPKHIEPWRERLQGLPVVEGDELMPYRVSFTERVIRRADIFADRRIGFYPLAIRHSLRHGFHRERWRPGHEHAFLDPTRSGPLPRWGKLEEWMTAWHFSGHRYVPSRLLQRMRGECDRLVLTNIQAPGSMVFLTAARRLRIPVVGYVASWDHTVGKGVVSPHLARYVVQNETMREDLERYHGVEPDRVVVAGWPQTDLYYRRRPRETYVALLESLGVPSGMPVVLFAGNTPTNSPYEGNLVARIVDWWRAQGQGRFSLLFRPHPRDGKIAERFGTALATKGIGVQRPSFTDLEDLATLLQHVDCVVANAGTILLDAIVNGRPAVCVAFDEGAPPDERWADLNLVGDHYRELTRSGAFYRTESFDDLMRAIERALAQPDELAAERRRVADAVVGPVDGRAARRVVAGIVAPLDV